MRCYFLLFLLTVLSATACTNPINGQAKQETITGISSAQTSLKDTGQQHSVALAVESRPYLNVETVALKPFVSALQAPARTEFHARAQAVVGAVVAGRLSKIQVQAGDTVKAGAPLAELSSQEAAQMRADAERAKAEVQRAEDRVKRQELMRASGVGLEVERVEAGLSLRQAQAEYARAVQAGQLLGNGGKQGPVLLRAPIDGVVLRVVAAAGSAVEAGDTLFELGGSDSLRIVADVFESDLPSIAPGAKVQLQFPALPGPVAGHVAEIGAVVQADLRRAPVYIEFDTPGLRLKPGMFAKATIQLADSDHIVLPTSSVLIKDGKRTVVYVETAAGVYESRDVTIGREREGWVPVLDGLADGERVVITGALLLDAEAQMLL